ncbi:Phage tail protein [Caprobacter fermentans]|uniref:Phage tail protein n=1 Tax=Caproicibacter fermentans TaxID=2576756 RepID=A0A6N8I019_9FIRM|nr:phage tail family protein [Caproicibacter fermentans]MVB11185.1 Phage tail protein [Caproicibacter fermentans]
MKIICENARGEQIPFGWFPPLWINSITGLGADYDVTTSKNSGQDGENYTGATASKRNIVLTLDVRKADYVKQRDRLYSFFQPRSEGTLYFYDDPIVRKIAYYVESIEPSGEDILKSIVISFICPDPKFYALSDNLTELATWEGLIEWPLEIIAPFEVTRKVNSLIGNVVNPSAVPMGLTVTFRASGTVVNPSLYDVNRQLLMQVNTTMHAGDQIVITTGDGNKRVKLIFGGVTTNINNLMAYPPHWLQAQQGDNLYRYNADEGIDNLSVSIVSTEAFWGA